jgi:PKHD-type hydroxylase
MVIAIPAVLDRDELARCRSLLERAPWVDGNITSGHQSALAKRNRQVPEESPEARELGAIILDALGRTPLFIAAALPLKVFPPLFNRYEPGDGFDTHVDNAVRVQRGSDFRIRTDLSATLFLNDPADYNGGELVAGDGAPVRLPAGDLLLYPASTLHHVTPVTRGARLASFFWIQSMVRDDAARRTLFELDSAIQTIAADRGQGDPAIVQLTGVYHNLLRRWAEL